MNFLIVLALGVDLVLAGFAVLFPTVAAFLPLGGTAFSQTGGLLVVAIGLGGVIEHFGG